MRRSWTRRFRTAISLSLLTFLIAAPEASWAFDPPFHFHICTDSIPDISHDTGEKTRKFTSDALMDIILADQSVDEGQSFFINRFHFCDELLQAGSNRLLDYRRQAISALTGEIPDGEKARKLLGMALHTLQDFYAHSNWIEMGQRSPEPRLGISIIPDPPPGTRPCPNDPAVLEGVDAGQLTAAFYTYGLNPGQWGCGAPAGKCVHGNPVGCLGIAKDAPADSPSGRLHGEAMRVAAEATKKYVEELLNDPAISGDDDAIRTLMGGTGTFGFVIDDTGSMGSEINQVKSQVLRIVTEATMLGEEPDEYLLVRYGDPDVGPPYKTDNASVFLVAIDLLRPQGGGDCPELAERGLLEAINESKNDSVLFLFTDASTKEEELTNAVISEAQRKRIKIIPILSGSCSPVHPSYIRNAEETGGQLFFLSPSELGRTFDLTSPFLTGDFETILMSRGTLAAGSSRTATVPVDSTVSRVVFSLSIDVKGQLVLLRPSGAPVASGEPGISIVQLSTGTIVTVKDPEPGDWQVRFTGSGAFSLDARGNSPVELRDFRFMEERLIPSGLFPIPGQPIAGRVHKAQAHATGEVASAAIRLLLPSGETLAEPDLATTFSGAGITQLTGDVTLPDGPFRVAVHGLDAAGHEYQRIFPTLFRGRTVEVRFDPAGAPLELIPGTPGTFRFVVTSSGAPATFRIEAVESHGFITRVQPAQVSLGTGDSATVEVDLTAPPGTPAGLPVELVATAVSTSDSASFNSAVVETVTGGNRPPDCAAAAGRSVELWPPNHKMVQIDLLAATGITDPDGDPVQVTADAITQDEPVDGLGDGDTSPDATGLGSGRIGVRAERSGAGNGRVYRAAYTASDGRGGSCQGSLRIDVPVNQGGSPAGDDGQAHDSTKP